MYTKFSSKIKFKLHQLSVDGNKRNSDNNNEFYDPTKGTRTLYVVQAEHSKIKIKLNSFKR